MNPSGTPENLIPSEKGEVRNPNGHNQYVGPKAEAKHALQAALESQFGGAKAAGLITLYAKLVLDDDPNVRLRVIRDVLDRMLGKPKQSMEIAGPAEITVTRKGETTTIRTKPDGNGQDGNGHE